MNDKDVAIPYEREEKYLNHTLPDVKYIAYVEEEIRETITETTTTQDTVSVVQASRVAEESGWYGICSAIVSILIGRG